MADYKSYLAASILTEDKVVKTMHPKDIMTTTKNACSQQNAKKPGAVHATYLVSGTKRKETLVVTNGGATKDGEDDYMQSSPFMSSSMPQPEEDTGETSVLSISLVREEELDDVTREMQELCATEDPLESASKYGSIASKNVKRRAARRPPPVAAPVPAVKPKPSETKEPPKSSKPVKEEPKSQPSNANDFFGKGKVKAKPAATSKPSSKESTPNPPTLKKESSSIFKSFAKAKPKPKPEEVADEPMKDVSDDEEETYVPPPPSKEIVDSDRKSRKEREAVLKKMMEEDDDDEEPAVATPELVEEEEPVEEPKPKAESEEKEEPPVVSGGRRRGRRRVMKKKTVKDDEGYLVTKEEMAWESFSEDEPAPAPKPRVQSSSTTTKAKKPAAKTGQGSIMSFFGKK
ncbi:DNA polymerase delta subunit 3 [Lachnellula arida]|uniref:DNA polymerase delta subunit 3 n=1 Tax=Lachnellula arida TaxID=1316785 RepID=A0A8T9BGU9_9HELO|nr:DNA polymerase delta subunit 3 [Lachnellula arida]